MCLAKPRPHALIRRERKTDDQRALREWAQTVKHHANGKCEICGARRWLEAHHIVKRSVSSKLRYDVSNGAALCQGHHRDADQHIIRIYGRDDKGRLRWEQAL